MAAAPSSSSVTPQALNAESLSRIASQPGNRVLQWAEPGEKRSDAFPTRVLVDVIGALKQAVVQTVLASPGTNEFMLRLTLSRKPVGVRGVPASYTWGTFAEHYPTFWSKLTSAASTRKDVVAIHAMLAARLRFEAGELESEKEVESLIQSDLIALNMEDGVKVDGGRRSRGDADVRRIVEQAKLRREVLHRAFRGELVPTEELAARGAVFEPAVSCLHKIIDADEAMVKKLKIKRFAEARKKSVRQLNRVGVTLARTLLQLRVAMAKECMGLPEMLDPVGATFMPTYTRSAQLACKWGETWVGVPREASL
jgi:hypothetical protein